MLMRSRTGRQEQMYRSRLSRLKLHHQGGLKAADQYGVVPWPGSDSDARYGAGSNVGLVQREERRPVHGVPLLHVVVDQPHHLVVRGNGVPLHHQPHQSRLRAVLSRMQHPLYLGEGGG